MLTSFSKECWTDIMRHSLVVILAVFLEVNAYNATPPVPGSRFTYLDDSGLP